MIANINRFKNASIQDMQPGVMLYHFVSDGHPGGNLYPAGIVKQVKKLGPALGSKIEFVDRTEPIYLDGNKLMYVAIPEIPEIKLTPTQRTYLRAAVECDSITNDRLRLQVLNKLANLGLLEPFNIEPEWRKNHHKDIISFAITAAGRQALEGQVS